MGLSQAAQVNKPVLSVGSRDRIVGGADLGTFFETEQYPRHEKACTQGPAQRKPRLTSPSLPKGVSMYVLGIDVGKTEIYVRLVERCPGGPPKIIGKQKSFDYDEKGLDELTAWLSSMLIVFSDVHAVMEATGVYWERCAFYLHRMGFVVSVVNPAQIKYFAQSSLRRGKTDSMDADIIARYGATMALKRWEPPVAELENLKLLVHERDGLVKELSQAKNRRHALNTREQPDKLVQKLTEDRIAFLKGQVEAVDQAMRERVAANTALNEQVKLLQSVPGFGFLTSLSILVETAAFSTMETSRQLAAYAGVSPAPHQSGAMNRRGRISKIGNPRLRRIVYLAAVAATRTKTKEKAFYQRLREQGKPGKVAVTALARKLLCVGFAVVKSGKPYDPLYVRLSSET